MLGEVVKAAFAADANLKSTLSALQSLNIAPLKKTRSDKLRRLPLPPPDVYDTAFVTERRFERFLGAFRSVEYLEDDFFVTYDPAQHDRVRHLAGKIVLVTNYLPQKGKPDEIINTLVNYLNFCITAADSPIVVWDWDNHHHLHISSLLAAGADVYCPSHPANDYELSCFCDYRQRIPACSHQWSREFVIANIGLVQRGDRRDDALGGFNNYSLFPARNATVETLSRQLPNVGFVDTSIYWRKTDVERLDEWTSYKCHWIVPTLNDVSIRVYDSLLTGGVVVVPRKFASEPVVRALHPDDYVLYDDYDLGDAKRIVARAVEKFDAQGPYGAARRCAWAVEHHNVDSRIREVLTTYRKFLELHRV